MPPYFAQQHKYACSLAVLRSVLKLADMDVSEEDLIHKVEKDYGKSFNNIWNPTITKLARQYGIETLFGANWPLLQPELLEKALHEYQEDPKNFNVNKYENPDDEDELGEPLPLAYREMFEAIRLGCKTKNQDLSDAVLIDLLDRGYIVQTSIKVQLLYPGEKDAFHSVLIYKHAGEELEYHDPARKAGMHCSITQLLKASNGTGAFMAYKVE